jgi:hypothetical protein
MEPLVIRFDSQGQPLGPRLGYCFIAQALVILTAFFKGPFLYLFPLGLDSKGFSRMIVGRCLL